MFKWHNETFNIWSHLLGKLVFLSIAIHIIIGYPDMQAIVQNKTLTETPSVPTYVSSWPLIIHLLSACFCMGCSAVFHLFQIHSDKTDDLLSRLDYGGISILIMGSSYPPIFYCFSCKQVFWIRNCFLALITTTSTASFIATLHPIMNTPRLRSCRAWIFIILGLSAGLPFLFLHNAP